MKRLFPFILLLVTSPIYAHIAPELGEKEHHDMHVAERDALADRLDAMQEQIDANTEGVRGSRKSGY